MTTQFIDRIYEASFQPDIWPEVLADLAALTDSKGGLLLSTREKSLNWTASDSVHDAFADYLMGGWFRRCGRRVCLLEQAHSAFLREHDYWTEDELDANEIYREFFRPRDLGCSAGTGLIMPTGDHIVVSVERSHANGPIEHKHIATLNELRPHLARAAMVAARMGMVSATSTKDAFEKLNVPAILLDLDGVAVDASDVNESLTEHIVWSANNRLSFKDADATALLQKALAAPTSEPGVNSFAVKDADGKPAHVAHLIPISQSAHDIFANGYAVLVFNPIDSRTSPSPQLLRSLFDLTAAEANVARDLAAGTSVDDIAAAGDVSINTVRTQIRKILEKTGCRRLPEVVSLISNVSMEQGEKAEP